MDNEETDIQPVLEPHTDSDFPAKELDEQVRNIVRAASSNNLKGIERIDCIVRPHVSYEITITVFPEK
ncbi:MAG: hypothetical protein AB7E47_07795 [Desulfovibrionaceae bacterium]